MPITMGSVLKEIKKRLYKHTPVGVVGEGAKLVKNVGGLVKSKLKLRGMKRKQSVQKMVKENQAKDWASGAGSVISNTLSPEENKKNIDKFLKRKKR